jgi:hypothetical protein
LKETNYSYSKKDLFTHIFFKYIFAKRFSQDIHFFAFISLDEKSKLFHFTTIFHIL